MEVTDVLPAMKPKMTVLAKTHNDKVSSLYFNRLSENNSVITTNGSKELKIGSYGDNFVRNDGVELGQQVICNKTAPKVPVKFSMNAQATEELVYESIEGTGELVAKDEILLSPAFSASIKKIIKSGQRVEKDEIVLIIDSQNLDTELQSKEIELTQKKVELKTEKIKANTELIAWKTNYAI